MKKSCYLLTVVAIALAMLFALGSCSDKNETNETTGQTEITYAAGSVNKLGSGENQFNLEVVDKQGKSYKFNINTDKTIVGEALEELGLIKGTEGDYGLYVTEVNGIVADYSIDGTYWAFYINGATASAGVDQTNIENGAIYALRVEK